MESLIEKYRYINVDDYWYETVVDDVKNQLENAGFSDIDIHFSGFYCQGDGASFTARWRTDGIAKTDEIYLPELRGFLEKIKHKHLKWFEIVRGNSRYCHENTVSVDDYWLDNRQADFLTDIIRDICCGIYRTLEREYEYLTSDSSVLETLQANEITE